jgi:hypothetical protein
MRNLKNLFLGAFVLALAACGGDDPYGQYPYYPGQYSGLACAELNGAQKIGVYTGNLQDGAKFGIDIYVQGDNQVAAVGDVYIPDINRFWNPGVYSPVGNAQKFVSCLTSNGYTGTMQSYGTGAYRDIDLVLEGSNVTITLGGSIPSSMNNTQLTGNSIVGPAYIQMNGVGDIFILE